MRRWWLNLVAKWRLKCWMYNYGTDDAVDLLLWQASQSNPQILKVESHYLIFEFMGLGVRIWNASKWHAWASRGFVTDGEKIVMSWSRTCPSPHVIWHLKEALNVAAVTPSKRRPTTDDIKDILYRAAVEADRD